jgi:hypothetical protein
MMRFYENYGRGPIMPVGPLELPQANPLVPDPLNSVPGNLSQGIGMAQALLKQFYSSQNWPLV